MAFLFSVVAVYAVAGALGGYLAFVERRLPVWARVALAVSGFMMFLPQLWATLLGLAFTAAVVTVGGGATTDMGGFVAATWLRGVRVVSV